MSDLPAWLKDNAPALIQAASIELAPDERLRASVEESVDAFYDGLHRSASTGSMVPLHAILIDWVEARNAPTEGALRASTQSIRMACSGTILPVEADRCSPS